MIGEFKTKDAAADAERYVRHVAWLSVWGLADPRFASAARRPPSRSDEHKLGVDDVLGILEDHYRRSDPETRLLNAHRVHRARQALVDQGTYTVKEIAEARDQPVNTVQRQLQRACKRGNLFTVSVNGEKHVPAVLLDEALEVRHEWTPAVSALEDAGMTNWGIWRWIAEPNAGLSGGIAADVIEKDPGRVYAAAQRRATQIKE